MEIKKKTSKTGFSTIWKFIKTNPVLTSLLGTILFAIGSAWINFFLNLYLQGYYDYWGITGEVPLISTFIFSKEIISGLIFLYIIATNSYKIVVVELDNKKKAKIVFLLLSSIMDVIMVFITVRNFFDLPQDLYWREMWLIYIIVIFFVILLLNYFFLVNFIMRGLMFLTGKAKKIFRKGNRQEQEKSTFTREYNSYIKGLLFIFFGLVISTLLAVGSYRYGERRAKSEKIFKTVDIKVAQTYLGQKIEGDGLLLTLENNGEAICSPFKIVKNQAEPVEDKLKTITVDSKTQIRLDLKNLKVVRIEFMEVINKRLK